MGITEKKPIQLIKIEALKSMHKLKLENNVEDIYSISEKSNLDDVIKALHKHPYDTRFAHTNRKQSTGHRRSITDMYRIASFYIPELKLHELTEYLINQKEMIGGYCFTVRKMVFFPNRNATIELSGRTEFNTGLKNLNLIAKEHNL